MFRLFGTRSKARDEEVPISLAEEMKCGTLVKSLPDILKDMVVAPVSHVVIENHTARNVKGYHENEDRTFKVQEVLDKCKLKFSMVGVCDGHDNSSASAVVARMLPAAVNKRLKRGDDLVETYTDAMAEMEDRLRKMNTTAGTCVNCCTIAGPFVWCANLGDCRSAVILLQGDRSASGGPKPAAFYWMSKDHKASCPNEIRRIRAAGGAVSEGRVAGLEPSRTLGDFDVKNRTKRGVISILPDVRYLELGDGSSLEQAILVSGTDGVWDVLTAEDICGLIQARKGLGNLMDCSARGDVPSSELRQPLKDLTEDVVQFAVAKGSQDDCTCIAALITSLPIRSLGR